MKRQLAPLKLNLAESEEVAIRQILLFKQHGFGLLTARLALGLPPSESGDWDDILKEMAALWETRLKHEAEAARKKQALYRQISVGVWRTSEDTGSEVSEPSAQVPLCSLWIGHGGDSGTHQDGKPGRDGA